jgi:hypothetical protein
MYTDEEILDLESRLVDLEIKRLLDPHKREQLVISKKTSAKASEKTLYRSTTLPDGRKLYEWRNSFGRFEKLSDDLQGWPSELRAVEEKIRAFDKTRTVNGRMISAAVGGTVGLV